MNLASTLRASVGDQHVADRPDELEALSRDLLHVPEDAASLAVAPGTVDELCHVVAQVYAAGRPIVARGAGWSYTRAHVPARPDTVVVDMRRLDRVCAIEVDDCTVTVEAGCTWRALLDALAPHGVRTPFWGPLSGHRATVGGTLAQDAVFFGSARYGTAGDAVLGLDVVRSDGTVLGTGAHSRAGAPFTRIFGPDLTGLFIGDAGAFGIKSRATLALVANPRVTAALSFAVEGMHAAVAALGELARAGLASELFAFDRAHHSLFDGVDDATEASVHAVVDAADEGLAAAAVAALRSIGVRHGAEIAAVLPQSIRADPFGATRTIFGPVREELLPPVNAVLPHSLAGAAIEALEALRPRVERLGLELWVFATVVGRGAMLVEPSVRVPAGGGGRRAGLDVRETLAALFDPLGAGHLQLGKLYAYAARLDASSLRASRQLKEMLDPDGLFNPGALGFGANDA